MINLLAGGFTHRLPRHPQSLKGKEMAGESVLAEIDVVEFAQGEFYSDDFGLISTPPPLTLAAALIGTTVAVTALAVFAASEIAGRYLARPRGLDR